MQIGLPQPVDRIQFFRLSLQQVVVTVELKQLLEQTAVRAEAFLAVELRELETHPQLHHLKGIMVAQMQASEQVLEEAELVQLAVIVVEILLALVVLVLHQVLLEHLPPTLAAAAAV
jgi:hypothetical protein